MSDDPRDLVATASRILGNAGHSDLIWGHASARDVEGRGAWLKSAHWGLEEITPDRVHLVGWDGALLDGGGQRHSEYPIHTQVMAARPDVGGVVHVHSPYSVALASSGASLRPVSHAANFFAPHGVPRFVETTDLILTEQLGDAVAAALGDARAVFLVNHGIVTVGADVREATIAAILLEMACQQQLITTGFGGWPSWTSPEESIAKRGHIYPESSIRAVWDYLERGLTPIVEQV
ncbi:class II aldolase/adducin family protein [uncultured Amnibacterium sp.]|uniref:class II aldolase/adducin family protein n=1 Tax=uncultured Amnibacterium sp. TaxID=1631851 RepID=UPI0035CBDB62